MKNAFVGLVFIFAFLVGHNCHTIDLKEMTEVVEKCQKKAGLKITVGMLYEKTVPKEIKCFLACLMQEKGGLKEDGIIDKDVCDKNIDFLFGEVPEAKAFVTALTHECLSEVKPNQRDLCEMSYEFLSCHFTKGLQTIFAMEESQKQSSETTKQY